MLTDFGCISSETGSMVVQSKSKRSKIHLLFVTKILHRIFFFFKVALWLTSFCHANFHERNTLWINLSLSVQHFKGSQAFHKKMHS